MKTALSNTRIYTLCLLFFIGCATTGTVQRGSVSNKRLHDGVYNADYRKGPVKAIVQLEIKNNKIVSVNVLSHRTMKGRKAETIIPERIVQSQSTDVDVVSGATYSSLAIMNAAQRAIDTSLTSDNELKTPDGN